MDGLNVVTQGSTGPVVLFVHGIPTSALLWESVRPQVATHARTYAVDLLGYGDSPKPPEVEPTLPVQADRLAALLRERDLHAVTVVGHDIGGGVAQLLALREPERVRGLVLVDSIAYDSFPEPTIARLAEPVWDERILGVDLVRGLGKSLRAGTSLPDPEIERLAARYAGYFAGEDGKRAYLRAARALHTEDLAQAMPAIERLDVPVRIVWGEADRFQPLAYAHRLHENLRAATLRIVPGGGHFLPHDRPAEVAQEVLAAIHR